jgi:hypothetical protein
LGAGAEAKRLELMWLGRNSHSVVKVPADHTDVMHVTMTDHELKLEVADDSIMSIKNIELLVKSSFLHMQ